MDSVVIDWSIWLVMTHLTLSQMGHLIKLNKKNDILPTIISTYYGI
jgi:hypothetical protein